MKRNGIIVDIIGESLVDYLFRIDLEELNRLYDEAIIELDIKKKKKITKDDKVDVILEYIFSNIIANSIIFVDDDIKQLQDIIDGKKIPFVRDNLLNSHIVFDEERDGKTCYFMLDDVREIIKNEILNKDLSSNKAKLVAEFYLRVNGVLKLEKLVELVKGTGFNIDINTIKKLSKELNYRISNQKIYYNDFAFELDKKEDLSSIKEENEHRIFSIEDIFHSMMEESVITEDVIKIINKKVKDEDKAVDIVQEIFDIISARSEYESYVDEIIEKNNIKLSDKEYDKLFEELVKVYMMTPSWELNGFCPFDDGCDCDCNCDCDDDWSLQDDFDILDREDKIEMLITMYLSINGVIRIQDMIQMLELYHEIKVSKKELLKIISKIDDIKVSREYIHVLGMEMPEIELILERKDEFGKYKVIEDFDSFLEGIDEVVSELDDLCMDYDIDINTCDEIRTLLNMFGFIPEEAFDEIFEEYNIKMSNKRKLSFIKEIKKISKDIRVWSLNGFNARELAEMNCNDNDKIGRNDLCSCGSGKKYKKCCGK